ncbi:MAG TPA: hypothetical protein ENF19_00030 [Candidatus Bathyarchaeota archaeon]|nr:hypothetical protein [Candidatus Bathyarchaeota archaeon]
MSLTEKVEVMDLIIDVLKEHERSLDELVERVELLLANGERPDSPLQRARVSLRDWKDFKRMAAGSGLVCFDMDESAFHCELLVGGVVYSYTEEVPQVRVQPEEGGRVVISGLNLTGIGEDPPLAASLSMGLKIHPRSVQETPEGGQVVFGLDADYCRSWLSKELGVREELIVQGTLED